MKQALDGIKPVLCSSWRTEVSHFGVNVAGYGESGSGQCVQSVVQLFKDGSLLFGFAMIGNTCAGVGVDLLNAKAVPWVAFEDRLMICIARGLKVLKILQLQQAAFVRLVISNLKGYNIAFDPGNWIHHEPIDINTLETSTAMIPSSDLQITEIARPVLDEFWQHFGVWSSPSYNELGEFLRKR
jgi:hypothetical protein